QFKEKAGKNAEKQSLGLYAYPSLMAADILVYHATHVPVGEDQKQHVELTRDIAGKFNHDYKIEDFFPLPEPLIQGPGARIMSLRDGTKKMSKSDSSENASIFLRDEPDVIAKKIKKATTDPEPLPSETAGLEGRAEAKNLVGIYSALSGKSDQEVLGEFGGKGFGVFKPALADLVVEKVGPIGAELRRLEADPGHLESILRDGAARASAIADPVVAETKKIVGFVD
ncbi:MAG: tryptophan--tRNA ligase, partial [Amphiplicatus sp.]|nr:tryptophan--tRNA ligase [Amphiplicatus sp.]